MYYTRNELLKIGFHKVGENVQISDKCSIYGAKNITIGNNVRIDDFCLLSAGEEIIIGDWVHIACYSALLGKGLIILEDFSGISMRCIVLSSNADYFGDYLTNPHIPEKYLNTSFAPVVFKKHSLLGAGSIVLPGVSFGKGAIAGAMSLVKDSIPEFEIWGGNPCRYIKKRSEELLKHENQLRHG